MSAWWESDGWLKRLREWLIEHDQLREHWGNPETLEDYERILHEMQHREQVVGVGRKDIMERHAIEDMIQQMRGEEE